MTTSIVLINSIRKMCSIMCNDRRNKTYNVDNYIAHSDSTKVNYFKY